MLGFASCERDDTVKTAGIANPLEDVYMRVTRVSEPVLRDAAKVVKVFLQNFYLPVLHGGDGGERLGCKCLATATKRFLIKKVRLENRDILKDALYNFY